MINRIGIYFILLGLGLVGLFIVSDIAEAPTCSLLIFGAMSLILGIVLYLSDPVKPGPPAGRLRLFKGFGKKPPVKK